MKKILILFIVFIFLFSSSFSAYSAFTAPNVTRLIPANAVAGAGGVTTVPALIKGTTSGGLDVSSWIGLAMPGGTQGKIISVALSIGLAIASNYLFEEAASWYQRHGLDRNLNQIDNLNVPNNYDLGDYNNFDGGGNGQFFNSEAAARAAGMAWADACIACSFSHGCSGPAVLAFDGYSSFSMGCHKDNTGVIKRFFWARPGFSTHPETQTTPKTPAQAGDMAAADIAAGGTAAADAAKASKAAIQVTANALDNPNASLNASIKAAMAAALAEAVTTQQKTDLEAQATAPVTTPTADTPDYNALTPAQIAAAMQGALQGQGLSATQIAAAIAAAQGANITQSQVQAAVAAALAANTNVGGGATAAQIQAAVEAALGAKSISGADVKTKVKEALDDETGVPARIDPTLIVPDKLSLTTVMQSFLTSLGGLPIIQTLQGITVNCSGSSSLCVALPSKFGGSVCYDAGPLTTAFNAIGSVLLSMTTIMGFIWIFKG